MVVTGKVGELKELKTYLKIEVLTQTRRINEMLQEGWEIIETRKVLYSEAGEEVEYHLGLPAETRINQLLQIIRKYEKYGLKSEMIFQMSEDLKEDLLMYSTDGGLNMVDTPLTKFLKLYEDAVNNRSVKYYKRTMHPYEDPELDKIDI